MTNKDFKIDVEETSVLKGRVKLIQPKKGFRAAIDSVFLAAAAEGKGKKCKLLDMGCGVGTVGLCAAQRLPNIELTGLDIQEEIIELAKHNADLNGVNAEFVCGSIKDKKTLENNYFDEIVMNPPYESIVNNEISPNSIKSTSNSEISSETTLEDWIKFAHLKLTQGGLINIIHKAERVNEITHHLMKNRWFGSIIIYPLHSFEGEDAKRVIVRAKKERYAQSKLKFGMIIHGQGGDYSKEAVDVLENAQAIDWS